MPRLGFIHTFWFTLHLHVVANTVFFLRSVAFSNNVSKSLFIYFFIIFFLVFLFLNTKHSVFNQPLDLQGYILPSCHSGFTPMPTKLLSATSTCSQAFLEQHP